MVAKVGIVETDLSTMSNPSDYSLQLNRWFLKPIGAWPSSSSSSRLQKITSFIIIVVCYSFVLFTLIPCLLHMLLENESLQEKVKVLGTLNHWIVGCINYTILLRRGRDIRYCAELMEIDWRMVTREKDEALMLKNARLGRSVVVYSTVFVQGSVLTFCFFTALTTKVVLVGNETRIVHELPCVVYQKLIDVTESPTYEIILATQFASAFVVNSSTVAVFGLAAVLTAHAHGQLSVVMVRITEFANETDVTKEKHSPRFEELGMIVEQHFRTLSFISCIEDLMNGVFFVELSRCTLDICILGYYILTEWSDHDVQNLVTYVMLMMSVLFNIFMICYIGEILAEQSRKVGEVVYMTNWYYLPDRIILNFILIIARSSVVVEITAGKIVHMSIHTFGDVIKTAFAYLNLLRQLT